MKYGIYYAYWEDEWSADYIPYIKKVENLGFDILEIACTPIPAYSNAKLAEIKACAAEYGITLTGGHGPSAKHNIASADSTVVREGMEFYTGLYKKLEILGITKIGGGIYSYWPVDYTKPIDKQGDRARSIENLKTLSKAANDCGINLYLEVLNRFEGYILNTAEEGVRFVDEVGADNVKLTLDTFHMNIEEDSFGGAIRAAGDRLGHLHIGEANRRVPGKGRLPWAEIGEALKDINFKGDVVMEPFVRRGGTVGSDIKIWRELEKNTDTAILDKDAKESLAFIKSVFER
ncbi:MAG: sugar phosphate isomerase/epimerase family protein [Eubacteriales bacterium]